MGAQVTLAICEGHGEDEKFSPRLLSFVGNRYVHCLTLCVWLKTAAFIMLVAVSVPQVSIKISRLQDEGVNLN